MQRWFNYVCSDEVLMIKLKLGTVDFATSSTVV
jgi:hypothetical protein